MTASMHEWDDETNLFAHSVIGYAIERLRLAKDPTRGALPADALEHSLSGSVSPGGLGGVEALRLFRDVLLPACRPMDDPLNLAFVPTAPSVAATMFDLVVSASSIFAGMWDAGAGAIAAENTALRWLSDLAGYPHDAGGVFVSGGSAANLSALVTARDHHRRRSTQVSSAHRPTIVTTDEVHASVRAAARVMDVDVLEVPTDEFGRLTGSALASVLDTAGHPGVFAVVATGGTTNAGAVDELDAIADVCEEYGLWLHVDGAYGLAALCSSLARDSFKGVERSHSFGVDPHKWLFAPYDCAALVYRDPQPAALAHAQHGAYLDAVDRSQWNPSDYAYHLSRRARGLPLWFSLATYGTDSYATAVDASIQLARDVAAEIDRRPGFRLLLQPQLSIVLFTVEGWQLHDMKRWSDDRARAGRALVVPTAWRGEPCLRMCFVNPRTSFDDVAAVLDDMAAWPVDAG